MKSTVIAIGIFLLLWSNADAETTKKKSQPTKQQQSEGQTESTDSYEKFKKDMAAREIQRQYYFNLLRINGDLQQQHINIKYYYKQIRLQQQEESLELSYRGRVPYSVSSKRQKLEDDRVKSEDKIKELEKEKDNLKLDALKYYQGSMPKSLSDQWSEEEKRYSDFIKQYTEELKALN